MGRPKIRMSIDLQISWKFTAFSKNNEYAFKIQLLDGVFSNADFEFICIWVKFIADRQMLICVF